MEWSHADPKAGSGTMLLQGSGLFVGEKDINLGEIFIQTLINEGLYVTYAYGKYNDKDALEVNFTTESNTIFL